VPGASGAWKELVRRSSARGQPDLTGADIALVTTAVAREIFPEDHGPCQGEILELKETVNQMVDQLRAFAAEVTRVAARWARKQAGRPGERQRGSASEGPDRHVNFMASNLTTQVRSIVKVVTAVATEISPRSCRSTPRRDRGAGETLTT